MNREQPVTETVKLEPLSGKLTLRTQPLDARVTLSNGETWIGARIATLPLGSYTVTAKCSGYRGYSGTFIIAEDKMPIS